MGNVGKDENKTNITEVSELTYWKSLGDMRCEG